MWRLGSPEWGIEASMWHLGDSGCHIDASIWHSGKSGWGIDASMWHPGDPRWVIDASMPYTRYLKGYIGVFGGSLGYLPELGGAKEGKDGHTGA